jgi:hypothetical protein
MIAVLPESFEGLIWRNTDTQDKNMKVQSDSLLVLPNRCMPERQRRSTAGSISGKDGNLVAHSL